jgi:hypothetical protein
MSLFWGLEGQRPVTLNFWEVINEKTGHMGDYFKSSPIWSATMEYFDSLFNVGISDMLAV